MGAQKNQKNGVGGVVGLSRNMEKKQHKNTDAQGVGDAGTCVKKKRKKLFLFPFLWLVGGGGGRLPPRARGGGGHKNFAFFH